MYPFDGLDDEEREGTIGGFNPNWDYGDDDEFDDDDDDDDFGE